MKSDSNQAPKEKLEAIKKRFDTKVNKTSTCWLWTAGKATNGYGQFWNGERHVPAHRWSYEFHTGTTIPKELFACHKCDVKNCVNPEHIFPGTQKENMSDACSKGIMTGRNHQANDEHPMAKLSDADVERLLTTPKYFLMTFKKIASEFGVTPECIRMAMQGITFKGVHQKLSTRSDYNPRRKKWKVGQRD